MTLVIENVHKTYLLGVEGVPALRYYPEYLCILLTFFISGVSLSVKKGEFVVIFGLSGGGKTTLLNLMGTIDKPTKGDMTICGSHIDSHTSDSVFSQIRLHKIGFVFQAFNLLGNMTALQNVEMPMILSGSLNKQERREKAISLLTKVGMGDRLDHLPSQLSGGEQQRVTIARSVSNDPSLLLLDEPTGDLDLENTCIVMKLLTELNQKQKITLIMVTHDVSMKGFANRVVWMRDGKIVRVEEISQDTRNRRFEDLEQDLLKYQNKSQKPVKHKMATFLRKPTDYQTHANYINSPENPVDFKMISQEEYEKQINLIRSKPSPNDYVLYIESEETLE